jgi:2-polyprenyl-6-methoxyphenol hydroxylase-like FAD-dependent oxidoreductase
MMSIRALVTGGSIAGPAVAWGLCRTGFAVTLLERAPRVRSAGQNVDIRGAGHEVLRRMGLRDEVAGAGTGELGTRFLRPDGTVYASVRARPGADGPTAELEILRGQLSELLLRATADLADHRYGDHLVRVDQDADGVEVVTAAGHRERYDLLVIAEGRRSRTRDLVLVPEYRDLGQYVAYGTIARADGDDRWWRWLTATGSRVASLRPDNVGTTRAALAFLSPPLGLNRLDVRTQLAVLRERFADVNWETGRILDGFAAAPEEFYFERVEQVRVPSWSHGRVAIVGDTAWGGPTGMGTTLALLGAHVLAGELAAERERDAPFDPARAFRAYERWLRPHVERTQRVPPGVPALALPKSRAGLAVLQSVHRLAASRALSGLAARALPSSASAGPALPDYPGLRASAA